jgi:hypothetical protein
VGVKGPWRKNSVRMQRRHCMKMSGQLHNFWKYGSIWYRIWWCSEPLWSEWPWVTWDPKMREAFVYPCTFCMPFTQSKLNQNDIRPRNSNVYPPIPNLIEISKADSIWNVQESTSSPIQTSLETYVSVECVLFALFHISLTFVFIICRFLQMIFTLSDTLQKEMADLQK